MSWSTSQLQAILETLHNFHGGITAQHDEMESTISRRKVYT